MISKSAFMRQRFPPPARPPCPEGFYHKKDPYLASKKNGDPHRLGQYSEVCLPPRDASDWEKKRKCKTWFGPIPARALQDAARDAWEADRNTQLADPPTPRKPRAPKKKTELQLILDQVDAAFKSGFPAGNPTPLTEESSRAIDKALLRLNAFYEASGETVPGPQENGKGKGRANEPITVSTAANERVRTNFLADEEAGIQADEYDSDIFNVDPTERKCAQVRIVVFATADEEPLEQLVRLRCKSNFSFKYFNLAKTVNAVPTDDNGHEAVPYLRYSLSSLRFTDDRVLDTLNLTDRGNIVIYRAASLRNDQCPDINTWIQRACASAFPDGWTDYDDTDLDDDCAPATSSVSAPVASTSSGGRSLKRKHTAAHSTSDIASSGGRSYKRRSAAVATVSPFLDEEGRFFDRHDREDRALPKFRKYTRPVQDKEVILVDETSEEEEFDELEEF
ncbi:hypothetical protein K438DRAFT_1783918 [Mycena galopus ATCC 62051]|nr:hypothetical protein K438DRAFT_1783918 [Mycena galopus ATCC 62051]